MSKASQDTSAQHISETTQPGMTTAARLSSNLKMYRSTPMRGEHLTLDEAAQRSGISPSELRRRIESGDLDACHQITVSSEDLAEEILTYQRREFARLIEESTGTTPTDETMVRMFGPRFASEAVTYAVGANA